MVEKPGKGKWHFLRNTNMNAPHWVVPPSRQDRMVSQ
jgi:hypothetical protein